MIRFRPKTEAEQASKVPEPELTQRTGPQPEPAPSPDEAPKKVRKGKPKPE